MQLIYIWCIIDKFAVGAIKTIAPVAVDESDLYSASPNTVLAFEDVDPEFGVVKIELLPSILCVKPEYVPVKRAPGIVPEDK
jgi:hypothetical protein